MSAPRRPSRRAVLAAGAGLLLRPCLRLQEGARRRVRIAAITDLHHGLAPDAQERLQAFVDAVAEREDLDLALQLGDFCHPNEAAADFLKTWNSIALPRHHVLGNHDMDLGSKDEAMAAWGMKERWSSFDRGGWHFVVLDLNFLREGEGRVDYQRANFYVPGEQRAWASQDELAWLAADLKAAGKPTVVFSHQPLGIFRGTQPPPQQREVLDVLVRGREWGAPVLACVFGHLHVDHHRVWRGIHCLCLNSASYHWAEGMHPYADPLFAFLSLEEDGGLRVEGRISRFVGQHPHEQGLNPGVEGVQARISERRLAPPG